MRRKFETFLIGVLIAVVAGCTAKPVQDVGNLPPAEPPSVVAPAVLQSGTGPINLARAEIPAGPKRTTQRIDEIYRAKSRRALS